MTIVAVTSDLMDRSRIAGALDDVRVVRPGGDLTGATVVLVDLSVPDALDQAMATGARVIAYGSHVETDVLDAARTAGAEVMPRSRFFRLLAEGTLLSPDA